MFIVGELYWHKRPCCSDENDPYYSYVRKDWFSFPVDNHGRQGYMLLYLGKIDSTARYYKEDNSIYGVFLYNNEKIVVNMNDLCMVDLSDKWHRKIIRKYGDKKENEF